MYSRGIACVGPPGSVTRAFPARYNSPRSSRRAGAGARGAIRAWLEESRPGVGRGRPGPACGELPGFRGSSQQAVRCEGPAGPSSPSQDGLKHADVNPACPTCSSQNTRWMAARLLLISSPGLGGACGTRGLCAHLATANLRAPQACFTKAGCLLRASGGAAACCVRGTRRQTRGMAESAY